MLSDLIHGNQSIHLGIHMLIRINMKVNTKKSIIINLISYMNTQNCMHNIVHANKDMHIRKCINLVVNRHKIRNDKYVTHSFF